MGAAPRRAEGDDALAPAPVVGPRCQLVSMPWNPDTGSNKPQGTNISYDRSGLLSPVFAFLVLPSNPTRVIKHNQNAIDDCKIFFILLRFLNNLLISIIDLELIFNSVLTSYF